MNLIYHRTVIIRQFINLSIATLALVPNCVIVTLDSMVYHERSYSVVLRVIYYLLFN